MSSIGDLLGRMAALRAAVRKSAAGLMRQWRPHLARPSYRASAANLAAYIGLRRNDLRAIQDELAALGLSSLGRCEGHVMPALDSVIHALERMAGRRVPSEKMERAVRAMKADEALLRRHTNLLFGPPPANRWTRFMVTLPTEAAADYGFVRGLMAAGMDCARINCAHDGRKAWSAMVKHVRRAERETGRRCRVLMDLAGPKLRTGPVAEGPAVLRVKVGRDAAGKLVAPAQVVLDASGGEIAPLPSGKHAAGQPVALAVPRPWAARLRAGSAVAFSDLRGRPRRLVVRKKLGSARWLASLDKGAWIGPQVTLRHGAAAVARCALVPPPVPLVVAQGDTLLLTREPRPGGPRRPAARGRAAMPAHISCTEPRIFERLKVGHRVWIDDGRIGAAVEAIDEHGAWLHVSSTRPGGDRIAPEKGLNLPDTPIPLPALSEEDLADLAFACRHADLVGFSFVRTAADVDELSAALAKLGRPGMGVIAKIETREAVRNLPEIIAHGAGRHPFGVMIARGDLAVEIGYERMAEIQEEILWLCEAARVPVVWATQVLETLVKRGRPSRAEISDAAMSQRAECVMLNKGPFLAQALEVLDNVVARMRDHQRKKTARFRALHW